MGRKKEMEGGKNVWRGWRERKEEVRVASSCLVTATGSVSPRPHTCYYTCVLGGRGRVAVGRV